MRALALDVGSKTIGLATSDPGGVIATPWETLARKGHVADAKEIVARVKAEAIERVVVGLPLELNGREGRRARAVREFLAVLEPALPDAISVELWDERFSTAAAERALIQGDMSRARRKEKLDAVAAQFILQGWLDARSRSTTEEAG